MAYLIQYIFYLFPFATVIFFAVSLIRFLLARRKNKRFPESVSPEAMKELRTYLIISSVIMGVLLAVVIGLMILLSMAIAYM